MRDKFSEMIARGIAKFEYTSYIPSIPSSDYISRTYNNIFGLVTDTHMTKTGKDTWTITGHFLKNKDGWMKFIYSSYRGGVVFAPYGYYSLYDFLDKNQLYFQDYGILNGDTVAIITTKPQIEDTVSATSREETTAPIVYHTTESLIPQNIANISMNNDKTDIDICFSSNPYVFLKNLNNSPKIKGNKWIRFGDNIIGEFGKKIYILENIF